MTDVRVSEWNFCVKTCLWGRGGVHASSVSELNLTTSSQQLSARAIPTSLCPSLSLSYKEEVKYILKSIKLCMFIDWFLHRNNSTTTTKLRRHSGECVCVCVCGVGGGGTERLQYSFTNTGFSPKEPETSVLGLHRERGKLEEIQLDGCRSRKKAG